MSCLGEKRDNVLKIDEDVAIVRRHIHIDRLVCIADCNVELSMLRLSIADLTRVRLATTISVSSECFL
jgi:hypothetical protein